MRLRLQLQLKQGNNVLPLNYQYPLSARIYKILNSGNREFATWLHDHGYQVESKHFKLFTFSRLDIPRRKLSGDRLRILSNNASLIISFHIDKATEHFIIGLFQDQVLEIADRQSKAIFHVETVEALPDPEFKSRMEFRCLSPICITRTDQNSGRKRWVYLSPEEPDYGQRLLDNLQQKAKAVTEYNPETLVQLQDNESNIGSFELLNRPKSNLITIKAGKPEETKVRGFAFRFWISAPEELLRLGYYAGFGEKNSLGFGCVETVDGN